MGKKRRKGTASVEAREKARKKISLMADQKEASARGGGRVFLSASHHLGTVQVAHHVMVQ